MFYCSRRMRAVNQIIVPVVFVCLVKISRGAHSTRSCLLVHVCYEPVAVFLFIPLQCIFHVPWCMFSVQCSFTLSSPYHHFVSDLTDVSWLLHFAMCKDPCPLPQLLANHGVQISSEISSPMQVSAVDFVLSWRLHFSTTFGGKICFQFSAFYTI